MFQSLKFKLPACDSAKSIDRFWNLIQLIGDKPVTIKHHFLKHREHLTS